MKAFKIICNVITTCIMIGLIAIAAVLFVPKILGWETMAVLSGSMEPQIHVGSVVIAQDVEPESLQVGDVITYQIGNDTRVTHRIVSIDTTEQTIITKGDANDTEDANPVAYSNVVGKEKFSVPYLGYITIYIKTPLGIGAGCGILIVLILLIFLPDMLMEGKKEDKEENKK